MKNKNGAVVLRWYDEVWNKSNESAIDELMHHDAKAFGLGAPLVSREEFKPFYRSFKNTFSDIHVKVDKLLVDGDYVTALCTVKATHKETGKPVDFTGTSICNIKNGAILEGWNNFDFLTMNLQIGKITPDQLL
jgi:predicted ester cyclase